MKNSNILEQTMYTEKVIYTVKTFTILGFNTGFVYSVQLLELEQFDFDLTQFYLTCYQYNFDQFNFFFILKNL